MVKRQRVETEYAPLYDSNGLGTTIFSPLASGILTGKYQKEFQPIAAFRLRDWIFCVNVWSASMNMASYQFWRRWKT